MATIITEANTQSPRTRPVCSPVGHCSTVVAGSSMLNAGTYSIIGISYPASKNGLLIALLELGVGGGMVVGPSVGGALYEAGGYKLPFLVVGALQWASAAAGWPFLPSAMPQKDKSKSALTLCRFIQTPSFIVIFICTVCAGISIVFIEPILQLFMKNQLGIHSAVSTGLIFLVHSTAYCVMCPIVGHITDKSNRPKTIMTVGNLMCAIGCLTMGPCPLFQLKSSLTLLIVGLIIQGSGVATSFVPVFRSYMNTAKEYNFALDINTVACISSGTLNGWYMGSFLGPIISGVMAEFTTYPYIATLISLLPMLGLLLLLLLYLCDSCQKLPSETETLLK